MKRLATLISAIFIGLVIFCVPLMTVNASSHHMMVDEVQFSCDDDISHLNCCSSNENSVDSFVFTNRTSLEVTKSFDRVIDSDWLVCLDTQAANHFAKIDFVQVDPIGFLIGSTIKIE